MSIESCRTMRLVEARYDGRLGEREAASVDRHVATCAACRAHLDDLPLLRAITVEEIDAPTPLQQQRSRAKLLYEAARVGEPRLAAPSRPRWATGMLLAAAMFAAAFVGWTLRAPLTAGNAPSDGAKVAVVIASASAAPAALPLRQATTVAPERGARFAQQSAGSTETVTLDEGAATFSVRPLLAGERFVIKTSDGEVELRGAVARVEATGSRVRAVTVQEGKAEVRYGGSVFDLSAGSTWSPPLPAAAPSASAPSAAPPSAPALPDARLGRAAIHAAGAAPAARGSAKASAPEPSAPAPEAPKVAAGATDFADAVRHFERGDYPAAARRLADFSKEHPDDGRAEDAAFLGILSLQRTGKTAEAAAAAQRYLQAYPSGYRRAEAARIAVKR